MLLTTGSYLTDPACPGSGLWNWFIKQVCCLLSLPSKSLVQVGYRWCEDIPSQWYWQDCLVLA